MEQGLARLGLLAPAAAWLLAGGARAQVTPLFSENFEGPAGPPGTVAAYAEVDPVSGLPGPTLWHRATACGTYPLGSYVVAPTASPFASILGGPGAVTLPFPPLFGGWSGPIALPFAFQHFGLAFQMVDVNSNGVLSTFPEGGGGSDFQNQAPGLANLPDGLIGAWWDDTDLPAGAQVATAILGAAPNREFVVEWNGLGALAGNWIPEFATFQVGIEEGTSVLRFRYDGATFATGSDPWSATCGTESFDGSVGVDLTGLGSANSVFPSTGFDLTPLPPTIPGLPPCFGSGAATYNQGDLGVFHYSTGAPNQGSLESPVVVSTAPASSLVLIFDTTKQTQQNGSGFFDQCWVEVSGGGGTWSFLAQISGNTGSCGGPVSTRGIVLPANLSGTSFQHRFRFDTVNASGSGYRGWAIDNVRIAEVPGVNLVVFSENFETGTVPGSTVGSMGEQAPSGTAADTLWHAEASCDASGTPIPPPLAGNAAAYNRGDVGVFAYNTAGANEGALVSPPLSMPGGAVAVTLAFDPLRETGATNFGQCVVEARPPSSPVWELLLLAPGNPACGAGGIAVSATTGGSGFASLLANGGGEIRLRFTSDSPPNPLLGWYVDNLSLTAHLVNAAPTYGSACAGSGGCLPTISASGLPAVGSATFAIDLQNAQPGALATLILGPSQIGVPVGLFLPGNPCTVLVTPNDLVGPLPVPAGGGCGGSVSVSIPIPCGLPTGAAVFAQFAVFEPVLFPAANSVSMTPGLSLTTL